MRVRLVPLMSLRCSPTYTTHPEDIASSPSEGLAKPGKLSDTDGISTLVETHPRNLRVTIMEKVPMPMESYRRLEAELHRLKVEERPRIIQQIAEARDHGDLAENAEYHAAKEAQGLNEAKVAELEDKLGRAEVI